MIVVSNASPLTNLAAIGHFQLLRDVYAKLQIPNAVWEELNAGGQRWPGREEVAAADWITRHALADEPLVTALKADLDAGEAESIALAMRLEAALLLLDRLPARPPPEWDRLA